MTPTVERLAPRTAEASLTYSFASGSSASFTGAERQRIEHFLKPLALNRHDTLIVSVPKGSSARVDAQRVRALDSLLSRLPAQKRYVAGSDFRDLSTGARSGVMRAVRTSGLTVTCPTETKSEGCANARNLAAMVAYPGDVFLPAPTGTRYLPAPPPPEPLASSLETGSLSSE